MKIIIDWLIHFPPEIATALLATLPVGELRASIPIGIEVFGLRPLAALIASLLGNAVPALLVIFGIEALTAWADRNFKWFHRQLTRFYRRTERVSRGKYEKYGAVALFLLTAIPLPLTGVWTASLAAVIFRIPHRHAFPAILLGMLVAGLIVSALTLGAEGVIRNLN